MSFGLVRGNTDLLFCSVGWFDVERDQREIIAKEVEAYHGDKLLNTSDDALIQYFVEKYRLDVPTLNRGSATADQRETQIDVSLDRRRYITDRSRPFNVTGTLIEVEVPFVGDREFFRIQPTTFSMNPPRAEVRASSIVIRIQGTDLNPEQVKQEIERVLTEIETCLDRHRVAAENFNNTLAAQIQGLITSRKAKLLKDRNLVAGLGFQLKPRDGTTYASPQVRRKPPVPQPAASTAPFKPEPTLSEDEYQNILDIMSNMVRVMECSPSAFSTSDEEAIRTHFLMQLNGHYLGQASGETFNYEGKTDILIKDTGRNIFIAECKFWRGEKAYSETIDQLLGYLTWRDTKAAILVFNRNKGLSDVLTKVNAATQSHPNCRRVIRQRSETSWIYGFSHRDDQNREMTVAVLVFDVPQKAS